MKNFYISIAIFITILSASVAGDIYVKNQMLDYQAGLKTINTFNTTVAQKKIENIKNKFHRQKNMLRLFINKEHINNLETNILLIENNVSQSDEIITESLCLISQISENIII